MSWEDFQPNVIAGVEPDQKLTLPDGRVAVVRHDPLAPSDRAWYATYDGDWAAPRRSMGFTSRDASKAAVEAML